jgi:hypothetical protein
VGRNRIIKPNFIFKKVLKMAEEIRLRFPHLNTLISCASVVVQRRIKSIDGLELTLQVKKIFFFG